jgi:hypothetical protein
MFSRIRLFVHKNFHFFHVNGIPRFEDLNSLNYLEWNSMQLSCERVTVNDELNFYE